jgi:rhodanese-related sulfurtransferase
VAGVTPGEISVRQLKDRLDRGDEICIVDVREPHEWDICNLSKFGSTLIPMREVPAHAGDLPRDRDIVVLCRSGARSARVTDYLRQAGFDRAMNLQGGIRAWAQSIDTSMPVY